MWAMRRCSAKDDVDVIRCCFTKGRCWQCPNPARPDRAYCRLHRTSDNDFKIKDFLSSSSQSDPTNSSRVSSSDPGHSSSNDNSKKRKRVSKKKKKEEKEEQDIEGESDTRQQQADVAAAKAEGEAEVIRKVLPNGVITISSPLPKLTNVPPYLTKTTKDGKQVRVVIGDQRKFRCKNLNVSAVLTEQVDIREEISFETHQPIEAGNNVPGPEVNGAVDETNEQDNSAEDETNEQDNSSKDETNEQDNSSEDETNEQDNSTEISGAVDETNEQDNSAEAKTNEQNNSAEAETNKQDNSAEAETNKQDNSAGDETNEHDNSAEHETYEHDNSAEGEINEQDNYAKDDTNEQDNSVEVNGAADETDEQHKSAEDETNEHDKSAEQDKSAEDETNEHDKSAEQDKSAEDETNEQDKSAEDETNEQDNSAEVGNCGYYVSQLLPLLKHLNWDQIFELEIESDFQGKLITDMLLPVMECSYDVVFKCNNCQIRIEDMHRICMKCNCKLCVKCCQALRHQPLAGRDTTVNSANDKMKTVVEIRDDKFICPASLGGCSEDDLKIKCLVPIGWKKAIAEGHDRRVG